MFCNVVETYINFIQNNIIDYLRIILQDDFDKKIATELTNCYIDSRYYGYNIDSNKKSFCKSVFDNLVNEHEKLKTKFPKKEKVIVETFYLFKYIFYIDGVKKGKELSQIVNSISARRAKKIKMQENADIEFRKKFIKRLESDDLRKKEFLKKLGTDKFQLEIKNFLFSKEVFDVSIKSNVKFKDVYREDAIERVFNKGLIAEDKLIIEYTLICVQIINDIIKGKFDKKYLINYTSSLLKKKRKNKQILNIVSNEVVQDKLIFKITYRKFLKNRYEVYDLMKKGYRFAVIIDKENNIDNVNLNMFKFIVVTNQHPKLEKYVGKFKNVIITNE